MAQLIVRNIEDALVATLKKEAARHGPSAEAEHREILRKALREGPRRSLKQHLQQMPNVVDDADLEIPRKRSRPVKL